MQRLHARPFNNLSTHQFRLQSTSKPSKISPPHYFYLEPRITITSSKMHPKVLFAVIAMAPAFVLGAPLIADPPVNPPVT